MRIAALTARSGATILSYLADGSWRLGLLFLFVVACSASSGRPLSIKMHNPNTNVTLNCAAHDTGLQNNELLANVVETCARQLETKGFVRAGSAP